MVDDPNPALRAELEAALAVVTPEIRGLEALLKFPISAGTSDVVMMVIDAAVRRRNLIQKALDDLGVLFEDLVLLIGDGYPGAIETTVLAPVEQEIEQELADLEAAVSMFKVGHAEKGDFNPERSTDA